MINFSTMGDLQYLYQYKIDKLNKNLIAEFTACIKNIDNKYFNIFIQATRISENNKAYYDTSIKFTDIKGKVIKSSFNTAYIMRLDHYMIYIDRIYRSKIKKEPVNLDFTRFSWYNSSNKTENEYQVKIGDISTNKDEEKLNLFITVIKENGIIKCDNDITIKQVTYNDGTLTFEKDPIEIYNIGKTGLVHFENNSITHDYYTESGELKRVIFSDLYVPEILNLNNIQPFCLLYKKVECDDKTINIKYDEFGMYEENDTGDADFLYERFIDEDNLFEESNSLHPIHIDQSNINVTNSDKIYALDSFRYKDDYNHDYDRFATFTREARKLNESEIDSIRAEIKNYNMDNGPILHVEDFLESIINETM